MAGEILGIRLLTLHNVHFFMDLVAVARKHIIDGTFAEWKKGVMSELQKGSNNN